MEFAFNSTKPTHEGPHRGYNRAGSRPFQRASFHPPIPPLPLLKEPFSGGGRGGHPSLLYWKLIFFFREVSEKNATGLSCVLFS